MALRQLRYFMKLAEDHLAVAALASDLSRTRA